MSDRRPDGPAAPWPPPFSETFLAHARGLLERRRVLVIVGAPGTGRHRLAAAIADLPRNRLNALHVARSSEADLAYFAIQELVQGLVLDPEDGSDEVEETLREVLQDAVPVLVVAEAHRCDPESVDVLVRLAGSGHLHLVATLPHDAAAQSPLLPVAAVIEAPTLDRATATAALGARFGVPADPAVLDSLLQRSAGSYGLFCELGDAAHEAGLLWPDHDDAGVAGPDHHSGVEVEPIARALALHELGENDQLHDLLASLDPETLTEDELLPYLRWAGDPRAETGRAELVERAITAGDPQKAQRRAAVGALARLMGRTADDAGEELVAELRALTSSAHLSPPNRAAALTALSQAQRHSGLAGLAVESAESAIAILLAHPAQLSAFHLDAARESHVLALVAAVDLPGAERAIDAYVSGVPGLPGSGRMAAALRCVLQLLRGDVEQALVEARGCLISLPSHDPHELRGWAEATLAQLLVRSGRPDVAPDVLEVSALHPASRLQRDLERRIAHARALDVLAEPEEALRVLSEVAEDARSHDLRLAEIDAAVLSVQMGGPPKVPMLLDAVDDLAGPTGGPGIWQVFARAARTFDLPALTQLAGRLDDLGARLFAAEVAQYTLDMARRSTDLEPATRAHLRELADPMSHRHVDRT